MKKTDKQLQQEVAEIRRFVNGDFKDTGKAFEKQIAKRPYYEGDGYADGQMVYDTWICPNCESEYEVEYDDYGYCPNCGQKLDWSDEE